MIKRITLRDVATFDHEGVTFDDLAKVNFIYGGNGTGKTTISRLLASWGDAQYSNCQIEWDGKPVGVLVYNKDFRLRNFKESIPGVFAVGKEWVNNSGELAELRKKRVELGNQAKRVTDRIARTKMNLAMEKGRLVTTLWYSLRRPVSNILGSFFEEDLWYRNQFSFAEKVTDWLKNHEIDETVTEESIRQHYKEYLDDGEPNQEKRELLRKVVMDFLAAQAESEVKITDRLVDHLQKEINEWEEEEAEAMRAYNEVEASIEGREKTLTSVQPAIDRINKMLEQSKFTGFSIQPSPTYPNYYQIQREDGSFENDTLSEGELNFIAFLYYYQLAMGNSLDFDIGDNRVLVIDDPMSSLDNNVMLLVSGMIERLVAEAREKNKPAGPNIEQVFVLTHNRMFHKQVSSRQRRADTHYWLLGKRNGKSYVKPYGDQNPVKGEYAMLWQELKEAQNGDDRIGLQNAMRRIIEYYYVGIGGYSKRKLIPDNFSDDPDELLIMSSLAKWVDEGSHTIDDDLYAEPLQDSGERYMEVFRRLFEKTGHLSHYKMMMGEE